MSKVYLVKRYTPSMGDQLMVICESMEGAEKALDEMVAFINSLHGPSYPPEWYQQPLSNDPPRMINTMGERVWIEEAVVRP